MTPIERLLATAKKEIGYLEKASNSQLDNNAANAGDKNYTKYARDLDNMGVYNFPKNGYAWCDMFVDWCFVKTFGLEIAMKMTNQTMGGYGAGCTNSADYYRKIGRFFLTNPEPGDQIFFKKNSSEMSHTGIVERVENDKVYTIEGNTSSLAGVVPNGGAVRNKSYSLNYEKIGGYGRPNYLLVPVEEVKVVTRELKAWEKKLFDQCFEKGIITEKEWLDKPDEKMDVVHVLAMLNNLYNQLKK